jgi:hypothetical protein
MRQLGDFGYFNKINTFLFNPLTPNDS